MLGPRLTRWIYMGAFAALHRIVLSDLPRRLRYLNTRVCSSLWRRIFTGCTSFCWRVHPGKHSVRALQPDSGCGLRADGVAANGRMPRRFTGTASVRGRGRVAGNCNLRGDRYGGCVHRAAWAQQFTSPGHAAISVALEPVFAVIRRTLWFARPVARRG